jgi:uncharacterized protein
MKNARELLEEFTAPSFWDPKKAAEMFTEDGAFEMPYLESFGFSGRSEGREAIEGPFVPEVYPDMGLDNIKHPLPHRAGRGFLIRSDETFSG